jgi:hypothetical protein
MEKETMQSKQPESWPDWKHRSFRVIALTATLAVLLAFGGAPVSAQEDENEDAAGAAEGQDDVSKAMDSTATQWSFQLAYQDMSWKDDTLDNGQTRAPGLDNYVQLRLVIPVALEKFTILPRVTLRHYENLRTGESGLGNTEIFALMIPKSWDWGSGRFGIGPLVTLPGDQQVARDEWGYGFATAAVNSSGKWFYGALLTQSWRAIEPSTLPPGTSETNPLGIAPIINYQLGGGWYVGNGDMVANYDWNSKKWYLPIGVRLGKVFVKDHGTWNFYAEYQTSLLYNDWPGSAVDTSIRVNVTYTIPMG